MSDKSYETGIDVIAADGEKLHKLLRGGDKERSALEDKNQKNRFFAM